MREILPYSIQDQRGVALPPMVRVGEGVRHDPLALFPAHDLHAGHGYAIEVEDIAETSMGIFEHGYPVLYRPAFFGADAGVLAGWSEQCSQAFVELHCE